MTQYFKCLKSNIFSKVFDAKGRICRKSPKFSVFINSHTTRGVYIVYIVSCTAHPQAHLHSVCLSTATWKHTYLHTRIPGCIARNLSTPYTNLTICVLFDTKQMLILKLWRTLVISWHYQISRGVPRLSLSIIAVDKVLW